jgi:hypothetical protein
MQLLIELSYPRYHVESAVHTVRSAGAPIV